MKLINNVCIMADKCNEVEKFDLQELEEFFDRQSFDKVLYKVNEHIDPITFISIYLF